MYFWDFHVEYFNPWNAKEEESADSLSEMLNKLPLVAGDLMHAPDDFVVPENLLERVECSQMIIREVCGQQHTQLLCGDSRNEASGAGACCFQRFLLLQYHITNGVMGKLSR
jgi:hypothetical protein